MLLGLAGFAGLNAYGQEGAGTARPAETRKEVSFATEDGWTIYGTLYMPTNISGPVAGAVMLSEPGIRNRDVHSANLARAVREKGMAALTVDLRGTGSSYGKKDFEVFSPKDIADMELDIKAAVNFLGSQKNVDGHRIAIVGAGTMADNVVRAAAENPAAVQAIVLASARKLSAQSRDFLASRNELPVFALVGEKELKSSQEISAKPYFLSENDHSTILFGTDKGAGMFGRPPKVAEKVADWLAENVKGLGMVSDVSFKSQDGWTIHGNLYMPDVLDKNAKVPAVVFIHGMHHEQTAWFELAREVLKKNMAALVFDLRGNRKSINEGKGRVGVDLSQEESAKFYLDAKAAIDFMASQKGVDSSRIALATGTASCNQTVRAAIGDNRIRTIVAMSFYSPDPDVKKFLTTSDMPLLLLANLNDRNADGVSLDEQTKEVYKLSKSKETQLMLFDDAGRGTNMLHEKPEVIPMILRWFDDKLAPAGVEKASR